MSKMPVIKQRSRIMEDFLDKVLLFNRDDQSLSGCILIVPFFELSGRRKSKSPY